MAYKGTPAERKYFREWASAKYWSDMPYREKLKTRAREHHLQTKIWVLKRYSRGVPKCRCCGELRIPFLTIDHITGGGKTDRKTLGAGRKFYRHLIRNGYPKGYRVLCFNCNCGRQVNGGICPHKEEQ